MIQTWCLRRVAADVPALLALNCTCLPLGYLGCSQLDQSGTGLISLVSRNRRRSCSRKAAIFPASTLPQLQLSCGFPRLGGGASFTVAGRLEKKRQSSTKGPLNLSAESWQGHRTKGVKKLIKPAAAAKGAARGSAGGSAAVNGADHPLSSAFLRGSAPKRSYTYLKPLRSDYSVARGRPLSGHKSPLHSAYSGLMSGINLRHCLHC